MKSYLELVGYSAKKRKKRNSMTLLCIAIAVFLVTGIFSMADVAIQGERIHTKNKHGYWHFSVKLVPEAMLNEIASEKSVRSFSRYCIANDNVGSSNSLEAEYTINGKAACICCCDEGYFDIVSQFEKDAYPKCDDEIILNSSMQSILGVKRGDSVTVATPLSTKEMKISGFIDENSLDGYDAIGAFVTVNAFRELIGEEIAQTEMTGIYRLNNDRTALKEINAIREKYNLSAEEANVNSMLLAVYGNTEDSYIYGFFVIACVLIVFVIMAGVFMIAGSISSNISERTAFYGMLRCIGASKIQIKRLVRLEALTWCKTAIPIGILMGTVGSWGLSAVLKNISEEFVDLPSFYISPIGIVTGILAGGLTVLLASSAPARRASRVSPMAAVSGNASRKAVKHRIRHLGQNVTARLGMRYAFAEKKSLLLISGSFALCIIVMFIFVSGLQLIKEVLPSLRAYSPDIEAYAPNGNDDFSVEKLAELNELKEVKNVFGRMYSSVEAVSEHSFNRVDLVSYDQLQFDWAKQDVEMGSLEEAITKDNCVVSVFEKSNPLRVGDRLTLNGHEVEVAAVLNNSPFSSSDIPTILCSESAFEAIIGQRLPYATIDIQLNQEYSDINQAVIRDRLSGDYIFSDRRQNNKETRATYYAFNVTVYAFILVVTLISVINIINSISMSTAARTKQLGIMRAIGLDNKKLYGIISAQGATYAVLGIVLGLALGLPVHYISYTKLITDHFGIEWTLPVIEILLMLLVVFGATALSVILPVRKIKQSPVTRIVGGM